MCVCVCVCVCLRKHVCECVRSLIPERPDYQAERVIGREADDDEEEDSEPKPIDYSVMPIEVCVAFSFFS